MKIGILSTNRNLYSTQRLVEAGEERGHEVRVINHKRCYMNIMSADPQIHYKGKSINDVLEMPIEHACEFFQHIPKIHRKLKTLGMT